MEGYSRAESVLMSTVELRPPSGYTQDIYKEEKLFKCGGQAL